MFLKINEERFRVLMENENGVWIISYDNPSVPVYVYEQVLKKYERIETPRGYIDGKKRENLSQAEKRRQSMIRPLLMNANYIFDKKLRREEAIKIAKDYNTTEKRILRLYYMYLARGTTRKEKEKGSKSEKNKREKEEFDWAIKKYYFSAKRISLRDAYDMLILEKYRDQDGQLKENIPTWSSFRHFYYRKGYHNSSRKSIARNGLTYYQRNERPILGTSYKWKDKIGYYQIDATVADIYLVSRLDRKVVVGRPNIYMTVDTLTQLITGVYVGFDAGEGSVAQCLVNAAMDKVKFCERYGIQIERDQWPSEGLPCGLITDQGSEFVSGLSNELCAAYDIEIENLPPFRPDQKGIIEKKLDILQLNYKPILRGKGVIEKYAGERWATDYRKQAVLNLDEFIQIVIHAILYINNKTIDKFVPTEEMIGSQITYTPNGLWNYYRQEGRSNISPVDEKVLYYMSLKKKKTSIGRMGISHNGILYRNRNIMSLMPRIRNKRNVTVSYDVNNISRIYLNLDGEYIPFEIQEEYRIYSLLDEIEYMILKKQIARKKKEKEKEQITAKVEFLSNVKEIVNEAKNDRKDGKIEG